MRLKGLRRRRNLLIGALAAALVVAVPVALASDLFTDVPNANPFHDDIGAIARAGITTGKTCVPPGTPPTYCPSEGVTREAMAAFMHRGYGRVAYKDTGNVAVPNAETPAFSTFTITPGLPAGALAGAAGFIKAEAAVTINLTSAAGCPCTFRGALFVTGVGYMVGRYTDVTLNAVNEKTVLAMTGAVGVGSAGSKTVEIRIFRLAGGGAATGYGNATATYYPFGSTGTNVLGAAPAPSPSPNGGTAVPSS